MTLTWDRTNSAIVPAIVINDLTVGYRAVEALHDVSLTLRPGRLTGAIGPNGAGKSTLMKAMLGLVTGAGGWVKGSVHWGDRPLADQRNHIAYVPQRSAIDPTYPATVWEVAMMGRVRHTGWLRRASAASRQTVAQALDRVGLADLYDRPIGQLSGGQQQRVFLARSLAQEADIFCFDEPFAGVDRKTEAILFEIFTELAAAGKIVLVVNHDLGESIQHFDDLILLNRRAIASGPRRWVLTADHLDQAYGSRVNFFQEAA